MHELLALCTSINPWTGPALSALILGIIGTTLGLANLAWNVVQWRWRTRVVLRVRPSFARIEDGVLARSPDQVFEDGFLAVSIVNESHFPVSIQHVSICFRASKSQVAPLQYHTQPLGEWPRKLDRKDEVSVLLEGVSYQQLRDFGVRGVQVRTADGATARGTCRAIKQLDRLYKSMPKNDVGIAQGQGDTAFE